MSLYIPILVAFITGGAGVAIAWVKARGDSPDLRRAKAMNEVLAHLSPSSLESKALVEARRLVVLRAASRFTSGRRTAFLLGIGLSGAIVVMGAVVASTYVIAASSSPSVDVTAEVWMALGTSTAAAAATVVGGLLSTLARRNRARSEKKEGHPLQGKERSRHDENAPPS